MLNLGLLLLLCFVVSKLQNGRESIIESMSQLIASFHYGLIVTVVSERRRPLIMSKLSVKACVSHSLTEHPQSCLVVGVSVDCTFANVSHNCQLVCAASQLLYYSLIRRFVPAEFHHLSAVHQ